MDEYYWTQNDLDSMKDLSSYSQMFIVAEKILKRIPAPIVQVCGPISTGGAGSAKENLRRMSIAIKNLKAIGKNVFNQLPFEEPMKRVIDLKKESKYDMSLLDEFYKPIFESGLVHSLSFMPNWQSSTGAKWEHEQAIRLGLQIEYLNESDIF